MESNPNRSSAYQQNYLRILWIRSIFLGLLLLALFWLWQQGMMTLLPLLPILLAFALFTGLSILHFRATDVLNPRALFLQLLLDIWVLTLLLYLTGGSTNPVVSYYLIPVVISAAVLPRKLTLLIALLCLTNYSFLLFFYQPLPLLSPQEVLHHGASSGVNFHVMGMWFNFVMSCFLITFFVTQMAKALKKQQRQLNQLKENELRDEQVLAIATLAAGTAHELGTPLSTIKLLAAELHNKDYNDKEIREDLQIILEEVDSCKEKLKNLVSSASLQKNRQTISLKNFIENLLDDWQLLRQEVQVNCTWKAYLPTINIQPPKTLGQSFVNLLDNAADASPEKLDIQIDWDEDLLEISIRDYGEGVSQGDKNKLGHVFLSNKEEGLGLGVLLSYATLNHFGGSVSLHDVPEGKGTITKISLPLKVLKV